MEWLVLIALAAWVYALWGRLQRVEQRLVELEQGQSPAPQHDAGAADPDPAPQAPHEEIAPVVAPPMAREAAPEPVLSAEADVPPEDAPEPPGPRFDFEDIFGRRLPIWAGGIALAAGGIFLVIYAIEQGLMGPVTRVALSLVFGVLLLAGAEAAYRFEERVRDPRVRQALAGAGIATLYAAGYLAGTQYGLIGPGIAFGGLALVTALALGLTRRFGLPTAVLGLVGGFATPVLVASEEANVPVLAFYLALLTAGLALTARRLRQGWLGGAGLAGGFLWGVLMLAGEPRASGDIVAIGLYLLALGAMIPLLLGDVARLPFVRAIAGAIAAVQMGALVALAGFGLLTWGLYGLLAAALAALAWHNKELRPAGLLVTAVAAILLGAWPDPAARDFVIVAAALGAVLLVAPLAMLQARRDGLLSVAQASTGALAFGIAAWVQFGSADNSLFLPGLAAGLGALAITAALGAWLAWHEEELAPWIALPVGASAVLAFGAAHVLLPDWTEVLGASCVAVALAAIAWRRASERTLLMLAWAGGGASVIALLTTGDIFDEIVLLFGHREGTVDPLRAMVRWGATLMPFVPLVLLEPARRMRRLAEVLLVLATYGLVAQIVPGAALAWALAVGAIVALRWCAPRTGLWATALVLGGLWALVPASEWAIHSIEAVFGQRAFVFQLPDWDVALRRILPVALVAGLAAARVRDRRRVRAGLAILAAASGAITAHVLFKQIFALDTAAAFVALGLAERTLWQALLMGGGLALLHFGAQRPLARHLGVGLALTGLLHFVWFSLLLHNPLWSTQAVGPFPLANLLTPAYGVAGAALWWLSRRYREALFGHLRQAGDAAMMLLIALWSLSALRHAFAGSVLTSTSMTQTEDLLRSFVGIVLALGFLWWGSLKAQRSWRIGSLVLILIAVLKVFLVDAAGLEGLLRVASFIALGASLIAIGWVYSRQLSGARNPRERVQTPP